MTPEPSRDLANFDIRRQPDDTTCGPTCLDAVYRHYGDEVTLDELREEIPALEGGGTLGVSLATHALRRGYEVTLSTWNLRVFDPTWFAEPRPDLREKLRARAAVHRKDKLRMACLAYVEYLEAGGRIEFEDLVPGLLRRPLQRGVPILTGLSASFLYRNARERGIVPDDVAGDPVGHFVVLTGYHPNRREVLVSDPLYPNPLAEVHTYPVDMDRLIGAIYLGVLTYDANLIVVEPRVPRARRPV